MSISLTQNPEGSYPLQWGGVFQAEEDALVLEWDGKQTTTSEISQQEKRQLMKCWPFPTINRDRTPDSIILLGPNFEFI